MPCELFVPRPCRWLLLLAGFAATAAAEGLLPRHRPITRREGALEPDYATVEMNSKSSLRYQESPSSGPSSLLESKQASASKTTDSQGRTCPGGVTCGAKADLLEWSQPCWDCITDYQAFYCEKNSLTSPPTFVDVCALEGDYRGAFCKKFAEAAPPIYHEQCFFPGAEYKQVYCEKLKHRGEYNKLCAADDDVGANYCETFATRMMGKTECHAWPGFMQLYCSTKMNATVWDTGCANHADVGAEYCEDFAMQSVIQTECVKYASYMKLYCDIQASQNVSVDSCATATNTAGMYCQELALKKNPFLECWGITQFDATYCAEISWHDDRCAALSDQR